MAVQLCNNLSESFGMKLSYLNLTVYFIGLKKSFLVELRYKRPQCISKKKGLYWAAKQLNGYYCYFCQNEEGPNYTFCFLFLAR